MRYIGIDPGAHSAVAIMDGTRVVDVTSIDTSKIKGQAAKLFKYHAVFHKILVEYKPEAVYCEEPYIKFRTASKSMNMLLGLILYTVQEWNPAMKVFFINPSVVKKTITGNGRADKDVLAEALMTKVSNPVRVQALIHNRQWDETDSIAIALAGYQTGGI